MHALGRRRDGCSFDELAGDQFLCDFAGQVAHIFFGKKHCGSKVLPGNNVSESKSLTQAAGQRARRNTHFGGGLRRRAGESGLPNQARQQSFDNGADQKNENEVGSGAAGKSVFSRIRHGSSQGLSWGSSLPTDPRSGIIHGRLAPASNGWALLSLRLIAQSVNELLDFVALAVLFLSRFSC